MKDLFARAATELKKIQDEITTGLEKIDGKETFRPDHWKREAGGGGGGESRVLVDGAVFEKAGVNYSHVSGNLPAAFAAKLPGEGTEFQAAGVSLVLHPRSPMIPTTHANVRCISKGDRIWFGGGADLTPYYLFESDAEHFHGELKKACDDHSPIGNYANMKKWCDDYFYLPHRGETRGVGGIFFDYLDGSPHSPDREGAEKLAKSGGDDADLEKALAFTLAVGRAFVPAYGPIAERRRDEPYGDAERQWQLIRRGRYVEFNLLYDRGTVFGLQTNGRTESILMSLPPLVRWDYCHSPQAGTREAELLAALKPTDWL